MAQCLSSAVEDNPPTAVWDESPQATTDPYKRCLNPTQLVTGALYTIKIGCQDDRLPKATLADASNAYLYNVQPNEVRGGDLCVDCSGKMGGSITGPKWDSFEECEFGCVNVGDTDARCLQEEEESEQQTSAGEEEDPFFSVEDCGCAGVAIAPDDMTSVSNNVYETNTSSGEKVEISGRLSWYWTEAYQSENLVGTTSVHLEISKFDNQEHAKLDFSPLKEDIPGKQYWCEEDADRCTVTKADFGEDRVFYAEGNIFVGGKGELPSSHHAFISRIITNQQGSFVVDISVTHPEKAVGDTWVIDTALAVESCALRAVEK
jgi:hypothetical protein